MATYFAVPANYAGSPQGSTVGGQITFTPNANGVALESSPPLGWVWAPTVGTLLNGNLQTSLVNSAPVYLLAQTSDLNLGGTLQYTASFEVTIGGTNIAVLGFVFDAQVPRTTSDAAMTSTSTTLTSATASFTSADVGAVVTVAGAIASGVAGVVTTIVSVTNSTTAVLSTAATATVSGAALTVCQALDLITVTPAAPASAVAALGASLFGAQLVSAANSAAVLSLLGLGPDVAEYSTLSAFPGTGVVNQIYYTQDTHEFYIWNGSSYQVTSGGASVPSAGMVKSNGTALVDATASDFVAPLTAQTANITASTTPTISQINVYDATSGALTPTLPPLSGTSVGAQMFLQKYSGDVSVNTVTFTTAGSDSFDNGSTTRTLKLSGEFEILQVISVSGTKKYKVVTDGKTLGSLDSRYQGFDSTVLTTATGRAIAFAIALG
jgi:hypothetical protein